MDDIDNKTFILGVGLIASSIGLIFLAIRLHINNKMRLKYGIEKLNQPLDKFNNLMSHLIAMDKVNFLKAGGTYESSNLYNQLKIYLEKLKVYVDSDGLAILQKMLKTIEESHDCCCGYFGDGGRYPELITVINKNHKIINDTHKKLIEYSNLHCRETF